MAKTQHKNAAAIKATILGHVSDLYDKFGPAFFDALEDSEKKRLDLNFTHTIDLSENAPVIDTGIAFKDKTTEKGMDVNKTFHASNRTQHDDPTQPPLPGAERPPEDTTHGGPPAPEGAGPGSRKAKK
jgi:hypothetical protein